MTAGMLPMHAIIVNYRTAALTIDCLASLEHEVRAMPGLRATVVDNASADGSADRIDAAIADNGWGEWATLIRSPVNGGFASGNNIALRHLSTGQGRPALLWLLNPDTRILAGAARALHDFMRDHPAAGIAGSALINGDGSPWSFAFRFPTITSEIERGMRAGPLTRLLSDKVVLRPMATDRPARVDWLPGASMVIRREVFDTIGLMDEKYFLYFEETDFCLAAQRAGWESWYVPAAAVVHIAGQSTGLNDSQPEEGRVPRYWFESRRRYFAKNHGRLYAMAADAGWALSHLIWCVRRAVTRGAADPPALLSDFLRVTASTALRPQR